VVQRVSELGAGLDVDDQRRVALDEGDARPAGPQVLSDIVTAVAGSDDKSSLTFPCFAIAVLAGMQKGPTESAQGRDVGLLRNAADTRRHHDVARMQLAHVAISTTQPHRPSPLALVVLRGFELG